MATASEVLALAKSYLGVKESPPDSNNVIFNTHYYGGPVNDKSLHWCVVFLWDIFRMVGASELFYGGKKTASCSTLYAYHKAQGQKVTHFQTGDIVFFDFTGKKRRTVHVGIVEQVEDGYITTIDGNTGTTSEANGGAVMRRRRSMDYVSGGYRPNYSTAAETEGEDEMLTQAQFNTMFQTAMTEYRAGLQDNDSGDWSEEARAFVMSEGLFVGTDTENGSPNMMWEDFLTREQCAQVLYRFAKKYGLA